MELDHAIGRQAGMPRHILEVGTVSAAICHGDLDAARAAFPVIVRMLEAFTHQRFHFFVWPPPRVKIDQYGSVCRMQIQNARRQLPERANQPEHLMVRVQRNLAAKRHQKRAVAGGPDLHRQILPFPTRAARAQPATIRAMAIARAVAEQLERASWIRRMFEIGLQLRIERGAENVFDYSLGNPEVEPPAAVIAALGSVVAENRPHSHGYMPNAGFPEVRASIAAGLAARTGLPFTARDIIMTSGAAGAINIVLKSILDPGDEVILLNPYFPEYCFYVENHGGRVVTVETDDEFEPDVARIAAAITPRTKVLLLNSPNNPTGVVYRAETLRRLNAAVREPVLVISDEPYRPLVYDGLAMPETVALVARSVLAWSWSKAMAISGERIGYLAIPPHLAEAGDLRNACTFANRVLGYINAPALWQRVVARVPDATVDVSLYQAKRDRLCGALQAMGYQAPRPAGSYYVFPKTPIPDDVAFIRLLQEEGILAVPGAGFGRGGYMRLSLTIASPDLERSLPGFERALRRARRP